MKCNIKQRYRDRTVGGAVDEGMNFGIQATLVKANELYHVGRGRIKKLEAAVMREIDAVKGDHVDYSESKQFAVESWIMRTDRDYQKIYTDYNYKYRNYPEKQLTFLFGGDYYHHFANEGTRDKFSDNAFDIGIWLGVKETLKLLNYTLQIGAPRLSRLEAELMPYIRDLRKYNLDVACHELWKSYSKAISHNQGIKKAAKTMGAEKALKEIEAHA